MASDFFLKIDTITGESKDADHADEIQLLSFSWGAMNSGSFSAGGGGGAGKMSVQDFHFTMSQNLASSELFLACAEGRHIGEAVLTCRKMGTDPLEFLKVTMSDVLISSYQTGASSGGDSPIDQVSLNFAKVKIEYTPQNDDGSGGTTVDAGWDLKKNEKL